MEGLATSNNKLYAYNLPSSFRARRTLHLLLEQSVKFKDVRSPNQVLTHAARAAAGQLTSGGRARRARRALVRARRASPVKIGSASTHQMTNHDIIAIEITSHIKRSLPMVEE